jgi:hypothetical protein
MVTAQTNLSNVLSAGPPALEGRPFSETLAKHLDALHGARKAFIEYENSERIRKALRNKIRTNNTVYKNGDLVWYKRKDGDRALGPGKVVFQDGKIIFVRHGMTYVRVSVNRIVKKGSEFKKANNEEQKTAVEETKTRTASKKVARKENPKPIIAVDNFIDDEASEDENNVSEPLVIDQHFEHAASEEENDGTTEPVAVDQQEEPQASDNNSFLSLHLPHATDNLGFLLQYLPGRPAQLLQAKGNVWAEDSSCSEWGTRKSLSRLDWWWRCSFCCPPSWSGWTEKSL